MGIFDWIKNAFLNGDDFSSRRKKKVPDGKTNIDSFKKEELKKSYYENGQLKSETYYINNKRNGLSKEYYENGQLEGEGSYKDNRYIGEWRTYHENGKLRSIENYKFPYGSHGMGQINLDQQQLFYYESGQLEDESHYVNGKLNGLSKVYYKNGKIKEEGNFKNNKLIGAWKSYFENGQLKEEGLWEGGKEFGLYNNYEDGKKIGPWKSNKEIDDLYDSMFKKIKSFDRDEDLEYWYKINLESVDNPISVNARENRGYSLEQEMLEFLWGHNEEYELKMQGYSQDDKEEFIGMRIISFGALLVFYNELIEKINSVSKRENIDLSEKINRLELETIHCKARLYGSIKFALTSNISKNKIKEWYDEFDDNNDLYIGLNPMDY